MYGCNLYLPIILKRGLGKLGATMYGAPAYRRVDAPVTPEHRAILERLSVPQVQATQLAGEKSRPY